MNPGKIPIGLQLYSIRNLCAQDLSGVLRTLRNLGYQGVEFAGYHKRSAGELRKMLDDNGLQCCGTHTKLETLDDVNFAATVEFNKELGNPFLIVPWIAADRFSSVQACYDFGKLLSDLAAKAKPHGMYVGYHAHAHDFKLIDGQSSWDRLFTNSSPDVLMQMDTANCLAGGGDPYATLRKFPGRSLTVHLKEHGGPPNAAIGEGIVNWNEIFQICESVGGTQWYIVEDETNADSIENVKKCIENLRKMGK